MNNTPTSTTFTGIVLASLSLLVAVGICIYYGWFAQPTITPPVVVSQYPVSQVLGFMASGGIFDQTAALTGTASSNSAPAAPTYTSSDLGKTDLGQLN